METIKTIAIVSSLLTQPLLNTMDLDTKSEILTTRQYKKLSQKKWICSSPYENENCNKCRYETCLRIGTIGSCACATLKAEDWCCECLNSNLDCKELCSSNKCKDLWFPLGEEHCNNSEHACFSTMRWTITMGILISPVIGLFSFSPCCNENGAFCCLNQIDVMPDNDNSTPSVSIEMLENNN